MSAARPVGWLSLVAVLMAMMGCGSQEERADIPPPVKTGTTSASEPRSGGSSVKQQTVAMQVVDLLEHPMPGMAPIATAQPNAFDKPVAQGALTGADGKSRITIDPSQWLYIRAWDPSLRWFANNYYELPPGEAKVTEELKIVMAQGSMLTARFVDAKGAPVQHEAMGLVMIHPDKGPWWPAEAATDDAGEATYAHVPPGVFLLRFKAAKSGQLELPEVRFEPGGATNLGALQLLQ